MRKFIKAIDILSRIINYVKGFSFRKILNIGGTMEEKTKQLLAYLIQNHSFSSITSLMKLSYIIDLVSVKKNDEQVSDFEYIRFKYGPFDKKIYDYIHELLDDGVILEGAAVTQQGEVVVYEFNDKVDFAFDEITENDKNTIDEILDTLDGYGPKALVDLTYKTAPMEKIGAKQGNDEGLYERLDLRA